MPIQYRNKTALRYILATCSYILLGLAGLTLAIPPGYSSIIFPAAGLAFIIVLIGGVRFLPSIWLGSFLLNLWIAFQSSTLDLTTVYVAAFVGVGASLQALVGKYLVQNIAKINWKELATAKEIVLFIALSGPIASLVAATWGNISLFLFNIINAEDLHSSWVSWWLGDSTGIITLAPLLLAGYFSCKKEGAKRTAEFVLPTVIALIVAISLFFYMSEKESQQIKQKLGTLGETIADNLNSRLLIYQEILASIEALTLTHKPLRFEEFKVFSSPLLERHPDLQAISLNTYVTSENRKKFEAQLSKRFDQQGMMIKELNTSGEMVNAQTRDWYLPVNFILPIEGNEAAIAYDIASDSLRLAAINKAIATNQNVITAPIQLVQSSGASNGILMLKPLLNQKTKIIDGAAVAVIQIENIIGDLLANSIAQGLSITIKDTDEDLDKRLLYTSGKHNLVSNTNFIWIKELAIGQRLWQISIMPNEQYINNFASFLPWQVLLVALWLVALLEVLLLSITGQHYLDSQKINDQNKTLETLAHYDILTGLPNRSLFSDRYQQAVSFNKRNKSLLAIGFLDLDKFKPVNDTYGHDIGDKLLIAVAQHIQFVLRENDTVCRSGGDEFLLLISGLKSTEECSAILNRLLSELAKPFLIETHTITISGSCGITLYSADNDDDLDTLLRHADQAMYQAKLSGRNQFKIFDGEHYSRPF